MGAPSINSDLSAEAPRIFSASVADIAAYPLIVLSDSYCCPSLTLFQVEGSALGSPIPLDLKFCSVNLSCISLSNLILPHSFSGIPNACRFARRVLPIICPAPTAEVPNPGECFNVPFVILIKSFCRANTSLIVISVRSLV